MTLALLITGCRPLIGSGSDSVSAIGQLEEIAKRPSSTSIDGPASVAQELAPPPTLLRRTQRALSELEGFAAVYSPDGGRAFLWAESASAGENRIALVSRTAHLRGLISLPTAGLVLAEWSPDSQRVVLSYSGFQDERPLGFVAMVILVGQDNGLAARTISSPATDGPWAMGALASDGRHAVATSPQTEPGDPPKLGSMLLLDLARAEATSLFVQPRPHASARQPYSKPPGWGPQVFSHDSRLMAFQSYPPDDYSAEAVWIADLKTLKVIQATREDREGYKHVPVSWVGHRQVTFERYSHDAQHGPDCYSLLLPPSVGG